MNNDSDNIRSLLLWLLQVVDPTVSLPSGNGSTSEANLGVNPSTVSKFGVGSDATSMKSADKPGSEGSPSYPSTFSEAALTGALKPTFSAASRKHPARDHLSDGILSQTAQSFNFGEIHAVQERFQALLKQRLR
ncbi:MAG: hypothetical protein WBD47_08830, partial [Phormidesmis sp.]